LTARLVAGLPLQTRDAGTKKLDQPRDACKRIARGGAHAFRSMEIGLQKLGKASRYVARADGFQASQRFIFRNCPQNPA
jgi:hypothetical protein